MPALLSEATMGRPITRECRMGWRNSLPCHFTSRSRPKEGRRGTSSEFWRKRRRPFSLEEQRFGLEGAVRHLLVAPRGACPMPQKRVPFLRKRRQRRTSSKVGCREPYREQQCWAFSATARSLTLRSFFFICESLISTNSSARPPTQGPFSCAQRQQAPQAVRRDEGREGVVVWLCRTE